MPSWRERQVPLPRQQPPPSADSSCPLLKRDITRQWQWGRRPAAAAKKSLQLIREELKTIARAGSGSGGVDVGAGAGGTAEGDAAGDGLNGGRIGSTVGGPFVAFSFFPDSMLSLHSAFRFLYAA